METVDFPLGELPYLVGHDASLWDDYILLRKSKGEKRSFFAKSKFF